MNMAILLLSARKSPGKEQILPLFVLIGYSDLRK
jgi:hypothetical protein